MTTSTLALTPGTTPGVGANAEHPGPWPWTDPTRPGPPATVAGHPARTVATAFERAARPDAEDWLQHVRAAAGCRRPVRLAGQIRVHRGDGTPLGIFDTDSMPDGTIYKACGNRRATRCPSCAEIYRADTYQLIAAGLRGGKGIPAAVVSHPAVFATLTAPGFGIVHTARTNRSGQRIRCRPRARRVEHCPHGVALVCNRIHRPGEATLGKPFCLDCYQHTHQAVWNAYVGELWRRTTIALNRTLAAIATEHDVKVRLSYAKVAEFQARGVVHFHAIIRLDGILLDDPDQIVPPHPHLTRAVLEHAIRDAVQTTAFTAPAHPAQPAGWPITWGEQLDIRPVHVRADTAITDGQVAAYLAKYATKSTEQAGHLSTRLDAGTIDAYADPSTHAGRLIAACWRLGFTPTYTRLRRWAHMLGYGGHFSTKSRRYSITLKAIRAARTIWRRSHGQHHTTEHVDDPDYTITYALDFDGSGWHTTGDALLANTSAAMAREYAKTARDEIAHEIGMTVPAPAAAA